MSGANGRLVLADLKVICAAFGATTEPDSLEACHNYISSCAGFTFDGKAASLRNLCGKLNIAPGDEATAADLSKALMDWARRSAPKAEPADAQMSESLFDIDALLNTNPTNTDMGWREYRQRCQIAFDALPADVKPSYAGQVQAAIARFHPDAINKEARDAVDCAAMFARLPYREDIDAAIGKARQTLIRAQKTAIMCAERTGVRLDHDRLMDSMRDRCSELRETTVDIFDHSALDREMDEIEKMMAALDSISG